jgi:hypothetical protein
MPHLWTVLPLSRPASFEAPDFPVPVIGLVTCALVGSLTVNRFGLRRAWPWIVASSVLVAAICLIGFQFFAVDLLLIPLLFSGAVSLLLVQLNRLWSLDRHLTRTLFNSSAGNAQAGVNASARLMSGVKLLNTVLPMSEALVFRCDDSNAFDAVARYKGPTQNSPDPRRNSVWR